MELALQDCLHLVLLLHHWHHAVGVSALERARVVVEDGRRRTDRCRGLVALFDADSRVKMGVSNGSYNRTQCANVLFS